MDDHRWGRVLSRSLANEDERLRRLFDDKDRVVALLRAGRVEPERSPMRYRSRYAATLWALAHDEPLETVSAA